MRDLPRMAAFHRDVLGLRVSDSMRDLACFLRCGAGHHTVNVVAGRRTAIRHLAFELANVPHVRSACDTLARHEYGHNTVTCHTDPEGLIVEHCAELDRMSHAALGYSDPRP